MTRTSSFTEETVRGGMSRSEKFHDAQELSAQLPTTQDPEKADDTLPENAKHQLTRDFGVIPIPVHLRYDPAKPFHFGLALNIAFGFFSTFSGSSLVGL